MDNVKATARHIENVADAAALREFIGTVAERFGYMLGAFVLGVGVTMIVGLVVWKVKIALTAGLFYLDSVFANYAMGLATAGLIWLWRALTRRASRVRNKDAS